MANRYWVGGDGTWNTTSTTNWSATSGGAGGASAPTSADTVIFDASSGTAIVTLGETVNCTFLNAGAFTGTLAFGTYEINVTGSSICYSSSTALTVTGTPVVNLTANASSGTRTISTGLVTEANAVSFNITAGTASVQFQSSSRSKNLNFTGFKGTFTAANATTIYGNLTLDSGMTWASVATIHTFGGSGVQTLTTNGVQIGSPITVNKTTGELVCADALTMESTKNFTITSGTVKLKAGAITTVGNLVSSSTNAKSLQSTDDGTQATLSKASGTVNAQNLNVKDIAVTGGATWNAVNGSVNQGNNQGWYFSHQMGNFSPAIGW